MIFERYLVVKEKIKPLKRRRGSRADFGPLRQAGPLKNLYCGLIMVKSEVFFAKFSMRGGRTAG
jgi:hypothetical protein